MQIQRPKIAKKYQPKGFEILHEDRDLIAINKYAGTLSVAALWNRDRTAHSALNTYVQKGNPRSRECVFVVHRLDQATSGVMVFAKSEKAQIFLKDNWAQNTKHYLCIVHGQLKNKKGIIESFLQEDDDYRMHSSQDKTKGKLARTEYEVLQENNRMSLVKINLLTGKKNQIRVHMSELKTPIVGDSKYGPTVPLSNELLLHSFSLEITHPFKKERFLLTAPLPKYFQLSPHFDLSHFM